MDTSTAEGLGVGGSGGQHLQFGSFTQTLSNEQWRNVRAYLNITYCLLDIRLHLLTQHAFKDKGVTKLLGL